MECCVLPCAYEHTSQPSDGCALLVSRTRLRSMAIQTEQIGSIPRPASLIRAIAAFHTDQLSAAALEEEYAKALQETIERLEQTGSPVITDGEQTKPSFATYALTGLANLAPDGVVIPLPMDMYASYRALREVHSNMVCIRPSF